MRLNEIEYNNDYIVTGICGLRQHWRDKAFYSYTETKRPDSRLTLILSGVAEYIFEGRKVSVDAGSIVSIPEGCNYLVSFCADSKDERVNTLLINFSFRNNTGDRIILSDKPEILLRQAGAGLQTAFEKAIDTACGRNSFLRLESFYSLLVKISRDSAFPFSSKQPIFPMVLDYIEENLGTLEAVPKLAGRFAMSESSFRRMFCKEIGVSPVLYINERRIERAKEMLVSSEVTIEAICESLGFYDPPYFYKCFEKKTGMSPGKYLSEIAKTVAEPSKDKN